MKLSIVFLLLVWSHCFAYGVPSEEPFPDDEKSNDSRLASGNKTDTTVVTSTELPSTVPDCNHSNGSTALLHNWFPFTYRFAIQCAIVFIIFLLVMLMCFYPDEPMFDISYSKYATNKTEKRLINA